MKNKILNIFVVFLLIFAISSLELFTNFAYADDDPGDPPPATEDSDDPTGTVLMVLGGIVLVSGIGYLIYKYTRDDDSEKRAEESIEFDAGDKIPLGLAEVVNGNMTAKNANSSEKITKFLNEALNTVESFALFENITLAKAREDVDSYIPYIVMGEAKIFGNVYEIELRTIKSKDGESVYSTKIVGETDEEIKSEIAKAVEEIHQTIKNLE